MCLRWREKLPSRAVVHQKRKKKKDREKTHTHTHRNSTDRDGNKTTGGFGRKTNQRDMNGEREGKEVQKTEEGGERRRRGQVGLLHDRMRIRF